MLINILKLIANLRPDLREKFGFDRPENTDQFLAWLITSGSREYASISEDTNLANQLSATGFGECGQLSLLQSLVLKARPDVSAVFPQPEKHKEFLDWFYTHGIEECGYWPFLTLKEKYLAFSNAEPWQSRIKAVMLKQEVAPVKRIPINARSFGVNLVGYVFGQLGIGEDVRMAARALLAVGVPMTMLDFPPGANISQNDRTMAEHVSGSGEFAVNFFCMTAEENGRYYAERGRRQFQDRYSIGYWPWELGAWPKEWEMLIDLVDEVWVSTQHTYDAVRPVCNKPLFVMPMAVQLGEVTSFPSRAAARRHFGLPQKDKLFCFAFDLNSYVDRKNPQACVDAFLEAFPQGEDGTNGVGLVIKVHKPKDRNKAWEKLKKLAAEDDRIHIIEETLSRPDLLALYQACDCFISLHRAEGFGRGLAEAMQLGLHVICTGYSGNVDFCKAPYADLVRYRLMKIRKNQYPYGEGQVWAEPDIHHAAELMRKFVLQPTRRKRKLDWPEFSLETVGNRYRERLIEIWSMGSKMRKH